VVALAALPGRHGAADPLPAAAGTDAADGERLER
jgi:hypothetical protein